MPGAAGPRRMGSSRSLQGGALMSSETNGRVSERPPRADVYLTQNFVMVELEVPGCTADELVIAASDRVVTVSGHRSRRTGDPHYLLHERGPDEFRRVFHLPAGSDGAQLSVQLADG